MRLCCCSDLDGVRTGKGGDVVLRMTSEGVQRGSGKCTSCSLPACLKRVSSRDT